jgi:hypothetical protein
MRKYMSADADGSIKPLYRLYAYCPRPKNRFAAKMGRGD